MTSTHRVLVVNRVGFLGGVERVLLTLAAGLSPHGWTPTLACPGDGELASAARDLAIPVAACPFDRLRITANPAVLAGYPGAWLRSAAAIELICRQQRIDLIHVHHPVTALYALQAVRNLGLPLVLHVHETLPARPLYQLAMRTVVRYAAIILCVSGAARELAIAMGAPPEGTRVVYNGIDPKFFDDAVRRARPSAMQTAGPGPHLGVFAVLEPRKGQDVFLQAAAMLAPRFPQARFWLVGGAALKDKAAYAERLRRMSAASALNGRVVFPGFQPDIDAWLAAMDVVVQPSVALESFGMSLAEAQALGRPVVAARIGGMPEVVTDGTTGLIVPPRDPLALARALASLIDNPSLRSQFGLHGAAEARRRFSPEVFCRDVAEAYDRALTVRAPHQDRVSSTARAYQA